MVIFNCSFMIEMAREEEFLTWIRAQIAARGMGGGVLSAMREAGGVDYREAESHTVAYQREFPSIGAARLWGRERFAPLAAAFEENFGPQAMVFTSIFERIDI